MLYLFLEGCTLIVPELEIIKTFEPTKAKPILMLTSQISKLRSSNVGLRVKLESDAYMKARFYFFERKILCYFSASLESYSSIQ